MVIEGGLHKGNLGGKLMINLHQGYPKGKLGKS